MTIDSTGTESERLLLDLLQAESPNPPGDVRAAVAVVTDYCKQAGLPYTLDSPASRRTNVIIDVHRTKQGPHLVWNGHLDTFPTVGDLRPHAENGRVHGRGAVDMKGGVAALLVAASRLHEDPNALSGALSLVLVCDEETFGPYGALGLLDRRPDLFGDALVSTEPSSLALLRVAERGLVWLRVTFEGTSLHAAYPDHEEGAILRMSAMVLAVRGHVERINRGLDADLQERPGDKVLDQHLGPGAGRITRSVSLNVGTATGGAAVNMKPAACTVSLDLRVPETVDVDRLLGDVIALAAKHGGTVEVLSTGAANSTAKESDVVRAVSTAVEKVRGTAPILSPGIGCTDARLWRNAGVPACVVGPSPKTMGRVDEFVEITEIEQLVEILVTSAKDYLSKASSKD